MNVVRKMHPLLALLPAQLLAGCAETATAHPPAAPIATANEARDRCAENTDCPGVARFCVAPGRCETAQVCQRHEDCPGRGEVCRPLAGAMRCVKPVPDPGEINAYVHEHTPDRPDSMRIHDGPVEFAVFCARPGHPELRIPERGLLHSDTGVIRLPWLSQCGAAEATLDTRWEIVTASIRCRPQLDVQPISRSPASARVAHIVVDCAPDGASK